MAMVWTYSCGNKLWQVVLCLGLMTLTLVTNGVKAKEERPMERTDPASRTSSRRSSFASYVDNEVRHNNKLPHFDQCGMINQVQSTVIQILNTHYEYGKGIHMLHSIAEGLQTDFSILKAKIDEVEKRISVPYGWNESGLKGYDSPDDPLPTLDPESFRDAAALSRTIQTMQRGLGNLTKMMQTQDGHCQVLEKKYVSMRRKLKKVMTEMHGKKTVDSDDDQVYLLEHYMKKQTDINSKLVHRIQALEQRLKIQADDPYVHKSQGSCPPGFVRHFSSCYLFVNNTANWIDAEKFCQAEHSHAHLVSMETTEEAEYLVQYRIHNLEHWASNYIWTGGNDMAKENVWRWVGTNSSLDYTNWRPGQPDNHNEDQHCVYFRADGADPRWDDWHCYAARLNYVCEINMRA